MGWYTDRSSSRQKPFLSALGFGCVATIIYALAKNTALLVIGRCIQGLSVSVLFAVGLAHLVDTVGRDEVGQWIGFVLSGMNLGVMLSPFLGGLVYDRAGYHAVFIMCIGVLAFVFLLRISIIERGTAAKYEKVSSIGDEAGYGICEAEETAQSRASSPSLHSDDRSASDKGNLRERSATEPNEQDHLIPSSSANQQHSARGHLSGFFFRRFPVMTALLTSPRVVTVWFGCFVHIAVITAFDAVLPIFVRKTFGWHATEAGLIFLAVTVPAILGAAIGGLSDRFGPRRIALAGLVIATPSVALLGLVHHHDVGQVVLLCFLLACTGKSK